MTQYIYLMVNMNKYFNYKIVFFYKTLHDILHDNYDHKHKLNKKVNNYPKHIVKLKFNFYVNLKCFKLFKSYNSIICLDFY